MLASTSRPFSPPHSTLSSAQVSTSPVQVKKVVVEGRSKHDGVSLRIFLKLSVVIENVLPGASIPLFPEDNIRIIQSKVHPLDDRSVPYHFSSTEQPLLQKTALALQLAPRSSRFYHTLFPHLSPPLDPTQASSSRRNRESSTSSSAYSNDERYTGHILVSGYNITLVLPKEFPSKAQSAGPGTESDGDDGFIKDVPAWSARSARRSSSLLHKSYLHLMAGLEVFIPYVLTPPKGPFLVSISVPRCLDNHLRLRISTPSIGSTHPVPRGSFTSASSEDDSPGWDFLTDPPVSRKVEKSSRKTPYHQSADDEHSDTPGVPSMPGTELIQGTYQSTDMLHVRWAPPLSKRSDIPKTEDGMRRIGIERISGKLTCAVLGRDRHRIKLGITYEGLCTGLWHPGVATILGMDIALDVKGRRVSWAEDDNAGWAVSGGNALGGLYSEAPPPDSLSRKSSFDSTVSSAFLSTLANRPSITPARGSASLLRAPLPNQNIPDYSFERSPGATPSPLVSSSSYFASVTPGQEVKMSRPDLSPGKSVTLKVNLLKLLPPANNELSFSIKGTVIIDIEEEDFLPLPTFRVLGVDKETVETFVSSPAADAVIHVGTHLPNAPKRALRVGEEMRCEEGMGLILRSWDSPSRPTSSSSTSTTLSKHKNSSRSQPQTQFPLTEARSHRNTWSEKLSTHLPNLPCVLTTITPLPLSQKHTHCVRVNIPMYSLDADTIEFGLALPHHPTMLPTVPTVAVDVLYASYAGQSVRVEVLTRDPNTLSPTPSGLEEPEEGAGERQFLVIVHLGDVEVDAGAVEVVYLVCENHAPQNIKCENKGKHKEEVIVNVLLPCFQLPIARYEVQLECPWNFILHINHSTLSNHHITHTKTPKLTHFRLAAGFFPVLALSLTPLSDGTFGSHRSTKTQRTAGTVFRIVTYVTFLAILYMVVSLGTEVRQVRDMLHATARALVTGVPYSDVYWSEGSDPVGNLRGWMQGHHVPSVHPESFPTTPVTSWEKENVRPATPTVDLAEATPVPHQRPPRAEATGNHAHTALIPLPAVSFLSWKIRFSPEVKESLLKGLMKAWYLLRKAWNFPMDPD